MLKYIKFYILSKMVVSLFARIFFLTFARAVTVAASIFLGVPPVFSFYIILMYNFKSY